MPKQVTCVVLGAGQRGDVYSTYALDFPKLLEVVSFADPRSFYRNKFSIRHKIKDKYVFKDWKEFLKVDRLADCALITLPDILHKEAAIAMAKKKYHILLEKPMSTSYEDCVEVKKECESNNVMLSICHVLRYTPQAEIIHQLIKEKKIGDVVNIQLLEPIGYNHFAHSYVRGNWRNEKSSACSLLTKSCHDIDLIVYWMEAQGLECTQVQSFGSLKHFKAENKPAGATSRCLDCPVDRQCAYSAKQIYMEQGIFSDIVSPLPDIESLELALKEGPYGRCVYDCDNDVMDNQVVNFLFGDDVTASFSMVAFTKDICVRKVKVFGTKGELTCNFGQNHVEFFNFSTLETHRVNSTKDLANVNGGLMGHGGADFFNISAFVKAVSENDPSHILTGAETSLNSHKLAFLADKSRKEKRIIDIKDHSYSTDL